MSEINVRLDNGAILTIKYTYWSGFPGNRWEPPTPDEWEITGWELNGVDVSALMNWTSDHIMFAFGKTLDETLDEWMGNRIADKMAEANAEQAEALYDAAMEEKLMAENDDRTRQRSTSDD